MLSVETELELVGFSGCDGQYGKNYHMPENNLPF
jgi:hypothetical protein